MMPSTVEEFCFNLNKRRTPQTSRSEPMMLMPARPPLGILGIALKEARLYPMSEPTLTPCEAYPIICLFVILYIKPDEGFVCVGGVSFVGEGPVFSRRSARTPSAQG